jgi:hypothetical protein
MKYIKIFENTPVITNSMVQFTSKNDKLNQVRDEINSLLPNLSDKKIGYNYAVGSKGIYYTTSTGELVNDNGYGCTTYSELLSNLEAILFTLKNINTNAIANTEEPIEVIKPGLPTNDIVPPPQTPVNLGDTQMSQNSGAPMVISVVGEEIERFESFKNKV